MCNVQCAMNGREEMFENDDRKGDISVDGLDKRQRKFLSP